MPENLRHKNFAKERLRKQYHENDMMQKRLLERKKEYLHKHKKNSSKSNYKGKANEQDSLALVALYNATDGDNWYINNNWLTGSVANWWGIYLDGNGRVTEIHLMANELSGNIPTEIGNLTSVTQLDLDYNQLTGSIPVEIGNLTNVIEVNLGDNQLSGSIPTEIGNLTSVTQLDLYYNQLTGSIPAEIGNLMSLIVLSLSKNQLSGSIPKEIWNLTSLASLTLDNNQLTGIIPAEMGNLKNLSWLTLDGNQLIGNIPAEMGNLKNVKVIRLSDNQLSGSIPAEIGNLMNLKYLYLNNNQLSGSIPAEIGNLASLDYLILNHNQLTGSIPAEIGNLTSLKDFYLNNNQLSGSIPAEMGNLMNLEYLYLNNNQLSGSIPAEIGNLTGLKELFLHNNQISGSIPTEIDNLTSLEKLYLYENQLSGNIPTEIGNLTSLTNLYLHSNQLSGSIPVEIGNLTSIEWLHLNDNQFYGLPDLSTITNMYRLEIFNNKFTFEDIEPNVNVAIFFNYSPQAKVGDVQHYTPNTGDNLDLSVVVGGTVNTYQWFKDSVEISGATNSTYSITNYNNTNDSGVYMCKINNTIAAELTLESRNIYVGIDVTTFDISASVNPESWGTFSGDGAHNDGATAELTATPNTGYDFENWTEDGKIVSVNSIYSFIVDSSRTLVANFDNTFDIITSANPTEYGTVNGAGIYEYGATAELAATPETGCRFVNWTEDGSEVSFDLTYSFTVTEDRTLVANFEDPTSISELENNVSFIVYPNPAKDFVNIQLNNIEFNNNLDVQLNLFDSLGRKLEVSTGLINSSIIQIDVSDKPGGIYYLQIGINNKIIKTAKLIISK